MIYASKPSLAAHKPSLNSFSSFSFLFSSSFLPSLLLYPFLPIYIPVFLRYEIIFFHFYPTFLIFHPSFLALPSSRFLFFFASILIKSFFLSILSSLDFFYNFFRLFSLSSPFSLYRYICLSIWQALFSLSLSCYYLISP